MANKTIQIDVTRERNLITYVEHWHTSNVFLRAGIDNQEGSYHQFLGSILFTAFTLEAFLNHLGELIFDCWDELESLTPKGKVEVISERIGLATDYGAMPWQVIPEIIAVRNKIAHGKNELIKDKKILSVDTYDQKMGEILGAHWQNFATQQNAIRVRENIEQVITILWATAGRDRNELFRGGPQHGSAMLID